MELGPSPYTGIPGTGDTIPNDSTLRRVLETLLAPLRSDLADSWRDAVDRDLRRWTGTGVEVWLAVRTRIDEDLDEAASSLEIEMLPGRVTVLT